MIATMGFVASTGMMEVSSDRLTVHDYDAAIRFLLHRVNYERAHADSLRGETLKLGRMQRLLERIGHPEQKIPVVHIAGTKGKGSTSTMVGNLLRGAGLSVGLFTSPHIHRLEERFIVNGELPSEEEVRQLVEDLVPVIEQMDREGPEWHVTFFEAVTAMAWMHYMRKQVQIAVLEVGLGGRLDSTNICQPLVCVITNISRDHTQILGATTDLIAREKAGIIKANVPVVSGVLDELARPVIAAIAKERDAPLWQLGEQLFCRSLDERSPDDPGKRQIAVSATNAPWGEGEVLCRVPLLGKHQESNTTLALFAGLLAWERWRGTHDGRKWLAVRENRDDGKLDRMVVGLENSVWPGRIELIPGKPPIILDAAHNWASMNALFNTLQDEFKDCRLTVIFGTTRDKDVSGLMRLVRHHADRLILTKYQENPRGVSVQELSIVARTISDQPFLTAATPMEGLAMAREVCGQSSDGKANDLIVITGSFYLIAEVRGSILARE
ncbi:bifunctional folylpolyglutamate synthase/dihydrofolate synthase [Planctopirus ephydatiae]|uniref:bifunctional folylpolyglutamate synthase/dihydrofolate synthase n=1 Tax=Planctopirus ephydatiae TaxID=2528019 RepID=UPI001FE9B0E4|nr:folylpolyglutamate synthase/dihydrofolate synthase family protein [Planctopirus ephydatiae]